MTILPQSPNSWDLDKPTNKEIFPLLRKVSAQDKSLYGDGSGTNTLAGLGLLEIERRRVVHYSRVRANNLGNFVPVNSMITNETIPVTGRYDLSAMCVGVVISGTPQFHLRIVGGAVARLAAFSNVAAGTTINFNASDILDLNQGQVVELFLASAAVNLWDYGLTVAYHGPTA